MTCFIVKISPLMGYWRGDCYLADSKTVMAILGMFLSDK